MCAAFAATLVGCSLAGLADGKRDGGVGGHGGGAASAGGGATASSGGGAVGVGGSAGDGPSNEIWAKGYGDANEIQEGAAIAIDRTCAGGGCPVVAGFFNGAIDFGAGAHTTTADMLDADVFVAKLAADGTEQWAKDFGNEKDQRARSVAVDGQGDVIVVGWFKAAIDFGGAQLTANPPYKDDAFVAKLKGSDGSHLWSKSFAGDMGVDDDYQSAESVAVDAAGNVVVAGTFGGKIEFGGPVHIAQDGQDIFLAKLGPDGSFVWSKSWDGAPSGNAIAVAVDKDGNILLTGDFSQALDFGCTKKLAAGSDNDIFVAKLTGDGTCVWNDQFGDDGSNQFGRAIVAAPNGDAIVVCELSGNVNFGGKNLGGSMKDVAVARLGAADGAHVWSIRPKDSLDQLASAAAVDVQSGGLYLVGSFNSTLTFDGAAPLESKGQQDIYLAKLDPMDGHLLWDESFGSIGSDYGRGVAVDQMGAVYATGSFRGVVDFGKTKLPSVDGKGDVFVAKFSPSPPE